MTYSKQLIEKRDAELAKADALVAAAAAEQRALSTEEDTAIASALDSVRDLDSQIEMHIELEGRNAKASEARKAAGIDEVVAPAVVKREARTYSAQSDSLSSLTLSLHSSQTTSQPKSVWLVT